MKSKSYAYLIKGGLTGGLRIRFVVFFLGYIILPLTQLSPKRLGGLAGYYFDSSYCYAFDYSIYNFPPVQLSKVFCPVLFIKIVCSYIGESLSFSLYSFSEMSFSLITLIASFTSLYAVNRLSDLTKSRTRGRIYSASCSGKSTTLGSISSYLLDSLGELCSADTVVAPSSTIIISQSSLISVMS